MSDVQMVIIPLTRGIVVAKATEDLDAATESDAVRGTVTFMWRDEEHGHGVVFHGLPRHEDGEVIFHASIAWSDAIAPCDLVAQLGDEMITRLRIPASWLRLVA